MLNIDRILNFDTIDNINNKRWTWQYSWNKTVTHWSMMQWK